MVEVEIEDNEIILTVSIPHMEKVAVENLHRFMLS